MRRVRPLSVTMLAFGMVLALSCGGGGSGGGENPPAGSPDAAFGTDGVAVVDQGELDVAYDVITDPAGRILVTGYVESSEVSQMAIWCLDGGGALDTSFGTDGTVLGSGDCGYGLAVDGDDRVVVTGRWISQDMALWRYDADGNPDNAFGSGGVFIHDGAAWAGSGPGLYDRGFAVAVDGTGNLLVAGESINADLNDAMVVWRIKDNGSLDTGLFGGDFSPADGVADGFFVHNGAASTGTPHSDHGYEMALDSVDSIVVAGVSRDVGGNPHQTLWKINGDGALDTTFGGDINPADGTPDGFAVFPDVSNAEAMALDSGDRIVAAALNLSASTGTTMALTLSRYTSSGVLDTTFGTDTSPADGAPDGFATYDVLSTIPTAVAVDGLGRVLVAGLAIPDTEMVMVLYRFSSSGMLDTTFGGDVLPADGTPDGFVLYDHDPLGGGFTIARSVHIDASGRILVAGAAVHEGETSSDMLVWRFYP